MCQGMLPGVLMCARACRKFLFRSKYRIAEVYTFLNVLLVSEYFKLKVCVTSSGRCRNKVLHLIVMTLLYHLNSPSCPCLTIHRRLAIHGGVINPF